MYLVNGNKKFGTLEFFQVMTLTNKQVPVLNLTETSITSQADLQDAFQSLCSHGGKESTEDKSAE